MERMHASRDGRSRSEDRKLIKWDTSDPGVHRSSCGRYVAVRATSEHWIAYRLTPLNTGEDLGTHPTDAEARATCERHAQARTA